MQRVFNDFREPGFCGRNIWLLPPPFPSAICLSFSVFLCVIVELTDGSGGGSQIILYREKAKVSINRPYYLAICDEFLFYAVETVEALQTPGSAPHRWHWQRWVIHHRCRWMRSRTVTLEMWYLAKNPSPMQVNETGSRWRKISSTFRNRWKICVTVV
jgi:hypothetical protein